MKFLVLGDTHGHNTWKDIIAKEKFDKVIFLGDYFDTYNKDITPKMQLDNFKEILALPNAIRLLGNHDLSYMNYNYRGSGFTYEKYALFKNIINNAYDKKKVIPIYKIDNILFSHAGLCKTYIEDYNINGKFDNFILDNLQFNQNYGFNPYGNSKGQSPLWIRPAALLKDLCDGYIQVVGHTPISRIIEEKDVYFCDTLPQEYLTIDTDIMEFKINKYK